MKKIITILLTLLVCIYSRIPLTCYALDFDPETIQLEYSDAPEGTAYIDVLAQIKEDDKAYIDFNVSPKRLVDRRVVNGNTEHVYEDLDIDENSEIAKYCEDGYVSLSIHSKDIESLEIHKGYGYGSDYLELNCNADELYNKYKKFKLAYVGENGEVLKITAKASVRYSPTEPYAFVANGKKATFRYFGISPLTGALIVAGIFAILFLIVIMPIFLIIKKIVNKIEDRKIINRIKKGEI